jgi:hypothetical protein
VTTAFSAISAGLSGRSQIEARFGRNTCYALVKLGLIDSEGVALRNVRPEFAEATVRERALASSTVNIVKTLLSSKQSGLDVGDHLSKHFRMEWSDGSKKRVGAALKQWAEWASA